MNVKKTRELNLCVSCEICKAVCPVNAITMEFKEGQFLPSVDKNKCIDCEKCIDACPGLDINIFEEEDLEKKITRPYIEGYSAYTKDREILNESTSGGVITQLIIELLVNGEYEGAFVLPFDMFDGKSARLSLAETEDEVKSSSKSKYLPASVYNIIKKLEKEEHPNYVIVGTSCQISGVKNFIKSKNIKDDNLLFLGLFCDRTLNFNFLDYIEEKFAKEGEKLVKFDYRNKEKGGWPGHVKAIFDSGREEIIDRKERIQVKEFFQLERCLYCLDKLNREADISFGDCYIAGKENPGRSSVIIRTEKGKRIWKNYTDLFEYDGSSIESIKKSQNISQKKDNLRMLKSFINKEKDQKLQSFQKRIKLGQKGKFRRIRSRVFYDDIKRKCKEKIITGSKLGLGLILFYLKERLTSNKKQYGKGNNVIIFGGELFNKGAQAMTFTVVDQIKRYFPEKKIFLLSPKDFERDNAEKSHYKFEILPWEIGTALNLILDKHIIDLEGISFSLDIEKRLKKIFNDTHFIIDISGYHLSSQFSSKKEIVTVGQYEHIMRIMLAKKLSIQYFILPQSIGPFDYGLTDKLFLYPLMRRYLKYPEKIYVREPAGKKSLSLFTKNNVEIGRDIVLLNEEYRLTNIFNYVNIKKINIKPNSIGIIPNKQVIGRSKSKKIYDIYENIINNLLKQGKNVYVLRHSEEDLQICQKIKDIFQSNKSVVLISEDLNAIELENIISQFDFIIGSRYHSIVHAYKHGVPAIVIGWAVKYEELLEDFYQIDYLFDIRNNLNLKELNHHLEKMLNNWKIEREKILSKIEKLEKNKIFNEITTKLS